MRSGSRSGSRPRSGSGKRAETFNFRGLNASIFNMPKISRGIHCFALESPKLKYNGCTARTASTVVRMNTGRVMRLGGTINSKAEGWVDVSLDQTMQNCMWKMRD